MSKSPRTDGLQYNWVANGDLRVSRKGDYSAGIALGSNNYYVDGWRHGISAINATLTHYSTNQPSALSNSKSLRVTATSAGTSVLSHRQEISDFALLAGKKVTVGAWVKANVANAKVVAHDGVNPTYFVSGTHTGTGDWIFLYTSFTVSASASTLLFYVSNVTADFQNVSISNGDYIEFTGALLYEGEYTEPLFYPRALNREIALLDSGSTLQLNNRHLTVDDFPSSLVPDSTLWAWGINGHKAYSGAPLIGTKALTQYGTLSEALNHVGELVYCDFTQGADSVYSTDDTFDTTGDISMAGWYKKAVSTTDGHLISKWANTGNTTKCWDLRNPDENTLYFEVYINASGFAQRLTVDARTFTDGEWHHVGAVHSVTGESLYIYIDGQEVGRLTNRLLATRNDNSDASIVFGGLSFGSIVENFGGQIQDVFYAKAALTGEDFKKVYLAGAGKYGHLDPVQNKMQIFGEIKNVEVPKANYIINGHPYVSERGNYTSLQTDVSNIYHVDRWKGEATGLTNVDFQQISNSGSPLPFKSQSIKYISDSANGSSGRLGCVQAIERFGDFAGYVATFSGWVRSNNPNARLNIQTTSSNLISTSHPGGDRWAFMSVTGPIEAATAYIKLYARIVNTANNPTTIDNGDYIEVTGLKFEHGSYATPFERRLPGEELTLCQRYYQRIGGTNSCLLGVGAQFSGISYMTYMFPVQMYPTTPSINMAGALTDYRIRYDATFATPSAVATANPLHAGDLGKFIEIKFTAAAVPNGTAGLMYLWNSAGYIEIAAEIP